MEASGGEKVKVTIERYSNWLAYIFRRKEDYKNKRIDCNSNPIEAIGLARDWAIQGIDYCKTKDMKERELRDLIKNTKINSTVMMSRLRNSNL